MIKKYVKYGIILLFLSSIVTGIYVYRQKTITTTTQNLAIKETAVKKGDIKINFTSDGKTDLPILKLKFQISGQLKEVMVNIGNTVKNGDILARLDDRDYLNKLDAAQINYTLAIAKLQKTKQDYAQQLETAKFNYNQAVTKLQKTKQDYEQQLATEKAKVDNLKYQFDNISMQYLPMLQIMDAYSVQDIESKKLAYENAKKAYETELNTYTNISKVSDDIKLDERNVEQTLNTYTTLSKGSDDIKLDEVNIEQALQAVKTAQDALDSTILRAPDDGEILYVSNHIGETVSNNTTSTSAEFITMADTSKLSVTAQVPEADLPKVELEQEVDLEFEALEGQIYKGIVSSIEPLPATDSSGLITYTVNIEIGSPDKEKMKSGMSCSVSFILKQKTNILIISNSAVKRVDGKQVVEVKDENGNIITKNIKTGLTDGKNVEILEGLKEGEKVITVDKK